VREAEGRAVLRRCFEARGLHIEEDVDLQAEGVAIVLDGYDRARRLGYEFVTSEAGDREEVTPEVVAALEARMAAGSLAVFLVDEEDIDSEADLEAAALRFLDEIGKRGLL